MSPEHMLLDIFDRMRCAGLLLDGAGRVIAFNAAAARSLEKNAPSPGPEPHRDAGWATQALRRILGRNARPAGLAQTPAVLMNGGARPLIMQAIALPARPGEPPATVLVLIDLETGLLPSEDLLRRVFTLTRAEAKLAIRLARGECLQEIAEAHDTSLGTVRMQLKSVFAKTGTCRQAELVALLSRLAMLPYVSHETDSGAALDGVMP